MPGNHEAHPGVAVIDCAGEFALIVDGPDDAKILARLEALQEILALLASVLIVDIYRQSFLIQVDAVAEQQTQDRRHCDDNHQAARIPENLHDLLLGHHHHARPAHTLRRSAALVVNDTNTSSRAGRICSMRDTAILCSSRKCLSRGAAASAS